MIIQMMPSGLLVFAFALSLASASPKGDSLLELRKLMRQQDESSSIAATEQFNKDIADWAKGLEQLGLDMAEFVEKCRLPGSHCQQRRVLRQLRVLRRGYTDLRARLEALEVKYVDRVSDQNAMDDSLRKTKNVLKQYDEAFKTINTKTYKLVDQ